jgi:hypothetical protein
MKYPSIYVKNSPLKPTRSQELVEQLSSQFWSESSSMAKEVLATKWLGFGFLKRGKETVHLISALVRQTTKVILK